MRERVVDWLRYSAKLDFGRLRALVPLRLALGVVIPLVIGQLTGYLGLGVSAAFGAMITGFADTGDIYRVRARVLLSAALAVAAAALLGGLVSNNIVAVVLISAIVAGICGYAAALGPHASMVGVLVMVVYSLEAGVPVTHKLAILDGPAMFCGGLLAAALALIGWPLRRYGGSRGQIADAWRVFAVSSRQHLSQMLSPELPAQLVVAASSVRACGATGPTGEWLNGLVSDAEEARRPMATLAVHRAAIADDPRQAPHIVAIDDFSRAVSRAARAIAGAIVSPWRAHRVSVRIADVERTAQQLSEFAPDQVRRVVDAFARAGERLAAPFPIGSRAGAENAVAQQQFIRLRLREQANWNSPILRHAIRLAVVMPIAWCLGLALLEHHQYWVPLTVAWVTRPDYGSTIGRVIMRVAGTLFGLILVGAVLGGSEPGRWELILASGVFAFLLFASVPVNYAIGVVFVTALVVTLLDLQGLPLGESLIDRADATVLGGLLVLVAVQVGPRFSSPGLLGKMSGLVVAMRRYADEVLCKGTSPAVVAQPVVVARTEAAAAVEAALVEHRSTSIDPRVAERVLDALLAAIFAVVSVESGDRVPGATGKIDVSGLDSDLAGLEQMLQELRDAAPLTPLPDQTAEVAGSTRPDAATSTTGPVEPTLDPARAAVHRAAGYLLAGSTSSSV